MKPCEYVGCHCYIGTAQTASGCSMGLSNNCEKRKDFNKGYDKARADCLSDFIKTIDACKKDLRLKSDKFENLDSIEQEVFSLDILKEAINRIKGE